MDVERKPVSPKGVAIRQAAREAEPKAQNGTTVTMALSALSVTLLKILLVRFQFDIGLSDDDVMNILGNAGVAIAAFIGWLSTRSAFKRLRCEAAAHDENDVQP